MEQHLSLTISPDPSGKPPCAMAWCVSRDARSQNLSGTAVEKVDGATVAVAIATNISSSLSLFRHALNVGHTHQPRPLVSLVAIGDGGASRESLFRTPEPKLLCQCVSVWNGV